MPDDRPPRDAIDEELWDRFVAQHGARGDFNAEYTYVLALRAAWEAGTPPARVPVPSVRNMHGDPNRETLIPLPSAGALIQAVAAHMNPADASTTLCPTCQVPVVPGRTYCAAHQPAVERPFGDQPPADAQQARIFYRQAREADTLAPSALTHRWRQQAQDWLAAFLLGGGGGTIRLRAGFGQEVNHDTHP